MQLILVWASSQANSKARLNRGPHVAGQFKFKAGLAVRPCAERLRLAVLLRKIKEGCGNADHRRWVFRKRVGTRSARCPLPSGTAKSAEEVSLAPASPTDCSAVLNSSEMSHSRSFDLLLTTPERGPESLWFEAGDCTDLASQCQRGGQQLQHDRAVSLPAEATAVAMPAASLMPPSSTSSRPTSWHEEPPPQQPQRQRQRSALAAPAGAAPSSRALPTRTWLPPSRPRWPPPPPPGSSPPEVARRGSADDLLDSPSDDNNDTGENGGGVVEILDGVHGGGGPAEDEEDDDATIVEDESTAAPLQQLSRSAMVN
uniref:Uncharacterized protein n=1 Tax=Macrostomum lignano TaxID=282301 RepID=A0A1I8FR17_9PLAT